VSRFTGTGTHGMADGAAGTAQFHYITDMVIDKDDNLLVVEGSVPGPNGGYLVITKAKKPPRERRGFAGSATVDPLKAAKRAAKKG